MFKTHLPKLGRPKFSASIAIIPVLACAYTEIASPLLIYFTTGAPGGATLAEKLQSAMAPRFENKVFWPALAAIALAMVLRNWSRFTVPPHIKWLFAYLALAGMSVLWAFKPDMSFTRFVQQAMIVASIALPAMLAVRTADVARVLFLCFAFALILNICFVFNQTPIIIDNESIGYPGYFTFKGLLGECAAIAFLLSLHEMLYHGWRRMFGVFVAGIATYLMIVSQSKGSLALALLAPTLAGLVLYITRATRISPAIILLPLPLCYGLVSFIMGDLVSRISYFFYSNYTLSGRTVIWDFVNFEIARKPLLGWGYQSFWLVGFDAPSITDAPGWIKSMPSAHNGYLDTMVDTGYIGLAILVIFIFTTLHAIGRLADPQPGRTWLLLSLGLFVILTNFLESTWLHGMDMLWLIFAVVAAEAGRHWQPAHAGGSKPSLRGRGIAGPRLGLARARSADGLARVQDRHP